ncbi:low-density lipoprotein receptor domain class A domain-containing protein [Phthorimaea operculella]|nr:low-density lipoprotein receptor domain class A domain-containing protein [Phthorimaea operculella]
MSRLYWTNWNETSPSIQRAYTSGRELQTVVSTDILMPNGLALDHKAKKIYWADARLDKIERMHYDGSHRHIVTRSSAEHPFDVAVAGDWVFWTDWVSHGVFRADKRAGDVTILRKDIPRPMAIIAVTPDHQTCNKLVVVGIWVFWTDWVSHGVFRADKRAGDVTILRKDIPRPMAIIAVTPDHQTCSMDPCMILNGGCAEICNMDEAGRSFCSCGDGRELTVDKHSCRPKYSSCADGQFACAEGLCIPMDLVCDGVPHCSDTTDASDEDLYYCNGQFACAEGLCIPMDLFCDGVPHCSDTTDASDEDLYYCNGQFACAEGLCIPMDLVCDGVPHCSDTTDASDEDLYYCMTPPTLATKTCTTAVSDPSVCRIPMDLVCDCEPHCSDTTDASDEDLYYCNGQFACAEGLCIPMDLVCDGVPHCSDTTDASDEDLYYCSK